MDITMDILESARRIHNEPNFKRGFSEYGQILTVQFSPFEWSHNLILIGFEGKILLVTLNNEENQAVSILSEFTHSARCTALSFSPQTSLSMLPNLVVFCTGGDDFQLRVYSSDLQKNNTSIVLSSHNDYINDCSFCTENTYLASVSDDNTAKVWTVNDYKVKCSFNLTSPGTSVCWHRSDNYKLLVAEKIGIIRFYNVETETPIISFDYGRSLSSAHWAPIDCDVISSLHLGELLIWNLTKPCLPVTQSIIFPENGGIIKFSPQGELVSATNRLDGSLKVVHAKSQVIKLSAVLTLPTNSSWHYKYPLVCVGDDRDLCFWKVT